MIRSRPLLLVLSLAVLALGACSSDTVTRAEWQEMTPENRLLYVRSLIGAEKVKDAKGGSGRSYARPAEEYMTEIDRAYESGDDRLVHLIFEGLEPSR